jgi:hypothetical protein
MLELISYGLTGLASMVVVAFCIVCGDNDAAILEKSAAPLNKAKFWGWWRQVNILIDVDNSVATSALS